MSASRSPPVSVAALLRKHSTTWVVAGAAAFGFFFAWYLYGPRTLDPRSVRWLTGESDPLGQYFGWVFFRKDVWRVPFGLNPHNGTLVNSSIVYTDSVPLLALPLKLVERWIPDPFQYVGLVLALNFTLNGATSAALALRLTGQALPALFFSVIAVTLPFVTMRGIGAHGHESLTATWVLWVALGLALFPAREISRRRRLLQWTLLLATATALHAYLAFMAIALCVLEQGSLVSDQWRRGATIAILRVLVDASVMLLVLTLEMWVLGYFNSPSTLGESGYGYFSAEWLTFFNPSSNAWFLYRRSFPSLSRIFLGWTSPVDGQYEGQAYLGLGAFWLAASALGSLVRKAPHSSEHPGARFDLALGASVPLFLLSLGNHWVFGTFVVDLPTPRFLLDALAIFRSSGRFSWLLGCTLLLLSLAQLAKRVPRAALTAILFTAVALQLFDLSAWHARIREWNRREVKEWPALGDATVEEWLKGRKDVQLLPPSALPHIGPFAWIAAQHGMTINTGAYARLSEELLDDRAMEVRERVRSGQLDPTRLYVLADEELAEETCARPHVLCHRLEKVTLAVESGASP